MDYAFALTAQNKNHLQSFLLLFKFPWEVEEEVIEQKEVVSPPEEGGSNRPLIIIIILFMLGGYIFRSDIYNFVFASNDTEESVQEDNEGNVKEEVALEEVISIIEEGDTSGIDQDLVAKMRSVKERTKKLDDKYLSGSIQEATYGRRLIDLNDEAWPLLQEYLRAKRASQKTSQTVPEPVPENPALVEAFDQIMAAKEAKSEMLGEAYLAEEITSGEYDSLFLAVKREAEYLFNHLVDFVSGSESVAVNEAVVIVERFKEFLKVEKIINTTSNVVEEVQSNADDSSSELAELLEDMRQVKVKSDNLVELHKKGLMSKKEFKNALLELQRTFYKLVKKYRDYIEYSYRLPEDMYATGNNIDWAEKLIRWIGGGKDMPMLKRSARFYKESMKRFEELMRKNFRNPTLGE